MYVRTALVPAARVFFLPHDHPFYLPSPAAPGSYFFTPHIMAMTAGIVPQNFEPHVLEKDGPPREIMERTWGLLARDDPTVSFEEYQYWAVIEREEERAADAAYREARGPVTVASVLKGRFSKGIHHENKKKAEEAARVAAREAEAMHIAGGHPKVDGMITTQNPASDQSAVVTEEEWKTASRALRTASWGTLFYLITTDILGWSTTP